MTGWAPRTACRPTHLPRLLQARATTNFYGFCLASAPWPASDLHPGSPQGRPRVHPGSDRSLVGHLDALPWSAGSMAETRLASKAEKDPALLAKTRPYFRARSLLFQFVSGALRSFPRGVPGVEIRRPPGSPPRAEGVCSDKDRGVAWSGENAVLTPLLL
jgi:hypothetical protein